MPEPSTTITENDLMMVKRQRDKAVDGGGTWQSWNRILTVLSELKTRQEMAL